MCDTAKNTVVSSDSGVRDIDDMIFGSEVSSPSDR